MERSCIDCGVGNCHYGDKTFPDFCISMDMPQDVLADAMAQYEIEENRKAAIAAAEVEAENYCRMTRVQEIVEFAKKMGFRKIGIANCIGLRHEAGVAARIFRSHGFEVYGAACKAGMQSKQKVGIPETCNVVGANMCNPILQAKLLNHAKTDLNVLIGLCVGHDSLFYKHSDALVTTLVAKDRVLGHNTVAALYQADKYYLNKLFGEKKD